VAGHGRRRNLTAFPQPQRTVGPLVGTDFPGVRKHLCHAPQTHAFRQGDACIGLVHRDDASDASDGAISCAGMKALFLEFQTGGTKKPPAGLTFTSCRKTPRLHRTRGPRRSRAFRRESATTKSLSLLARFLEGAGGC